MDIWTERLERRHLVIVERWVGRTAGALTPNDLPDAAEALADWFSRGAAEPGRLDCLLRVYDTPVGLASLRRSAEADTAELSLLLCEVGYNPLRTATYAAMRMLDRAFSDTVVRLLSGSLASVKSDYSTDPNAVMEYIRRKKQLEEFRNGTRKLHLTYTEQT